MYSWVPAVVLGTAALVTAQNAVPVSIPSNSQIGLIHFPLACHTLGILPVTLDAVFTATLSVYGQSGQHAYLDDVTATLKIPHSLTGLAGIVGGEQANTNVYVNLDVVNGSPAVLPVFPNGYWINNTQFNNTGDTSIRVPSSGVLPPIGPIALGTAGSAMEVYFGAINATVYILNSNGSQVLIPLEIQCPVPDPSALLAIINVEPATSKNLSALKPALGYVPDYPVQAIGSEFGYYNFDLACDSGSHGIFDFQLVPSGAVSSIAKPGSQFNISDVAAYLTVGQSAIGSLRKIYPGIASVDVTIDSFYLGVSNATPSAINGIHAPFTTHFKLPSTGGFVIDIPADAPNSTLTVGPLKAGNSIGTQMYLTFQNATAQLTAYNSAGKNLGDISFSCLPEHFTQLIGILITYKSLPTYSS